MKTKIIVPEEDREIVLKNGAKYEQNGDYFYVPKDAFISKFSKYIPLTVELVPSSNWFKNVRSELSEDWGRIKRISYKKAGYRCEICGGIGDKHPVECHEIWDYDLSNKVQILTGLISLCPTCHKVKHSGLAIINGEEDIIVNQLKLINDWEDEDVYKYLGEVFAIFEVLSTINWELDLSFLDMYV